MKTISTTAIVALMTASIGLGAVAPVLAQDAAPTPPPAQSEAGETPPAPTADRGMRMGPGIGPGMRHGGGMDIFDIGRGAEAIEIALVRLSHAIDLTDEQTALMETLKTEALAAAETFETATQDLRPTPPVEGETPAMPDMSERFADRIAIQTAQLEALEAVQPAFTAFFDSLTDTQKTELMPQGGEGFGGPGKHLGGFGQRPMGPGNR